MIASTNQGNSNTLINQNLKKNKTLNNSNNNITKQSKKAIYSKNIENIDYLLKVADKNKRQLQESYGKQVEVIEKKISKHEKSLNQILQEINEKENQIFEVQKVKLEGFKNEVEKFEKIKNIVEEHLYKLNFEIKKGNKSVKKLINQTHMLYEDYLSFNNEAYLSKSKVLELKETLTQIEKTYPKDFEFLFEDIEIEKELNEMETLKNQIHKEIKILEIDKVKLTNQKLDKEERKELVDVEFKKIDEQIEESYRDEHLKQVESYLVKNVSNLLEFQNLQNLIQGFYNLKQFDIENEVNVLVMKNLGEKLTDMKNEFYQIKNEKVNELSKLAQDVEDLKNQIEVINNNCNSGNQLNNIRKGRGKNNSTVKNKEQLEEQLKLKKEEGEKLHQEINKLELNCKKKETLFNKYLILLRNKCTKSEEESYYKQNPCLILDNNFEELLKQEMINNLRERREGISDDDIKKWEGTIDIYFRDLFERERTIQLILLQRTKIEAELKQHQDIINSVNDKIQEEDNEIKLKKMRLQEVNKSLKDLQQRVETRNRTLKMNLENLSESNFMDYLNSNEELLKSMKKIYGNKVLSKVFKAQKDKFYENVMLDHTFKKNKINEFVRLVGQYEITLNGYETNMSDLLESFKESSYNLDKLREHIDVKKKEEQALRDARNELIRNLDVMLGTEMEQITSEKIKLREKLNCDFYFVKVKELASKIENLKLDKEKVMNEFFRFRDVIIEKEQKLYKDDDDNKKNLANIGYEDVNSDLLSSKLVKSTDRFIIENNADDFQINSPSVIPHKVNSNTLNQLCDKDNDIRSMSPVLSQDGEKELFRNTENINNEDNNSNNNNDMQFDTLNIKNKIEESINDNNQYESNNVSGEQMDYRSREVSGIYGSASQQFETTINLYEPKTKLQPQSSHVKLSLEKIEPFLQGMNIYKKHAPNVKKQFDPIKSKENPPETCGYAFRGVYLNNGYIEFKKDKKVESKVKVLDLKSILLTPQMKKLITQYKKNVSTRPNSSLLIDTKSKLEENKEYVMFKLILENDSIDLIAHNYIAFICFNDGIEELISYKKSKTLEEFLELCYKKK